MVRRFHLRIDQQLKPGATVEQRCRWCFPPATALDVAALKAVKGIGAKTAQRILVDLQDKMGKDPSFSGAPSLTGPGAGSGNEFAGGDNTARSDALAALCNLGFDRRRVESVLDQLMGEGLSSVEDLVRAALKRL